jgi:hypothetical protein
VWITLALAVVGAIVYATGLVAVGVFGLSDLRTIYESFAAPPAASVVRT